MSEKSDKPKKHKKEKVTDCQLQSPVGRNS